MSVLRHVGQGWAAIFVVLHNARSLTTAFCADEYFIFKPTGAKRWFNKLKPQLATTAVTAHRWQRLDQGTHLISISLSGTNFQKQEADLPNRCGLN
jgi:hypothetical protein